MSTRIKLLSENVANMIAAGEVVERPASVVKELVENALDAEAARVHVDIEAGGRNLVRVTDDGIGMTQDDALLSLERHATSKILSEKDLFSVATMGFRGEAIPAIASVSKFTLRTCARGADAGTEIYVEGGTLMGVEPAAVPPGTEISVHRLFFNTPGRRKFLRSPETELTHVVETLTRLALPREGVFFRLRQEDKTLLQVARDADLPQRIASLLGPDAARSLVPLEYDGGPFRLSGYVSGPQTTRSNTANFFVYCNGRFLRDRLITHAINAGYRGHILKGRYPTVVLMIDIPAELVDVNVHPTKSEVRFRQPSGIYEGIVEAVDRTLRHRFGAPDARPAFSVPTANPGFGRPPSPPAAVVGESAGTPNAAPWPVSHVEQTPAQGTALDADEYANAPQVRYVDAHGPAVADVEESAEVIQERQRIQAALERFATTQRTAPLFGDVPRPATRAEDVAVRVDADPNAPVGTTDAPDSYGVFSRFAIVGQVFANYILCETREGGGVLLMIDAHAAHERILFEKLKTEYEHAGVAVQRQLVPIVMELRPAEAKAVLKAQGELAKVGIDIEEFGQGTFRITGIPSLLSASQAEETVRECVDRLLEAGQNAPLTHVTDDFLSTVACHSAVRSGQELTVGQMREILRGLDRIDGSGSCPHGRPTVWSIPLMEIEKRFKRR
ncbi:DNA mismatch repair endonuclease MutL [bacterium]|nr:DNA mismatch repair endonuclease MutL [bacterium]